MTSRTRSAAAAVAALLVAALLGAGAQPALAASGVVTDPNDGVPRTSSPPTYSDYPAIQDPGPGSPDYFQPFWYDTDGRHIQAHGGQIVTVQENGQQVQYWYGEDRTKGYWNSPGVAVYRSTDGHNWVNKGTALRSVSSPDDLKAPYFDALYDTVDDAGQPRASRIAELDYHLDTTQASPNTAIFERPKVLFNAKTGKWVMWWHSDGRITPGGSTYARSMAGVAVSDSPTGPFTLQGVYRLYNRANYQDCTTSAVPGQARDMTVFQDADGTAYISYSSEENYSLYVAKLNSSYTNVERTTTTDTLNARQYSADGTYPYVFADGKAGAPVRGTDFQIVKECGHLEAPAIFSNAGSYYAIASGATSWAPNPQTYYTADSVLGTWIRGVEKGDANETVAYNAIPEGGDGLLSVGDTRGSTFGSQSTNVLTLAPGKYVYMGDRWNEGEANSTYVWLPMTVGENGRLEMRNPAVEDPARWGKGWNASYWDDKGVGAGIWSVVDDRLPKTVRRGANLAAALPSSVSVSSGGATHDVAVTWAPTGPAILGTLSVTGTLAADSGFTAGRRFTRTIEVAEPGIANVAPGASVSVTSRPELATTLIDGNTEAKGWDDWSSSGYPRDSRLSFTWSTAQNLDSVTVHAFKDGTKATWPSRIDVEYQANGAWTTTSVSANLTQLDSDAAPTVVLDLSSLPDTTGLRLHLTSAANTWQSISEVQIWGAAPPTNVCRVPGAVVSASFSQTKYATLPASNACDGNATTPWSTWTDGTLAGTADFTLTTTEAHRVAGVSFTNIEGTIASVSVAYRGTDGTWRPTSAQNVAPAANNALTTIPFAAVSATGVKLTFSTPNSYLKITEITVPEVAAPALTVPVTVSSRCIAGKAVLSVTATNGSQVPVDVSMKASYGTKSFSGVAAGSNAVGAFTTRQASMPAGQVVVTATGTVGGSPATLSQTASYPARTC
ncbi:MULTISPECIES: glycoside hydrolase family 43 protein [unclassified Rathayibacter]|uniref:glycoside hydrolase family 43 protein n=1 Tax=unclassified Rathayibacter TaxID=2609250 RepID=UPI00188B2123|nr:MULTISPECIES: glycoside hydrolase family 43 protein [unclassified Rathayibacter]MBF4462917.1 discoidin domain-containing protein [Rathayibacter sp. VKM Ac-2879]MBF4504331.1 discoidin domain-containing protein [Rathayibacter sp. VKM Ac-2878]